MLYSDIDDAIEPPSFDVDVLQDHASATFQSSENAALNNVRGRLHMIKREQSMELIESLWLELLARFVEPGPRPGAHPRCLKRKTSVLPCEVGGKPNLERVKSTPLERQPL